MSTIWATSYTIRSATGLIAGPLRPPNTFPSSGFLRSAASAMPDNVFTAVRASAPASAMARAIGRTSATLGDSFTRSGRSVTRRTAAVTSPAASASIANWSPSLPTLGQLMLSSIPATPGTPSSRRQTAT